MGGIDSDYFLRYSRDDGRTYDEAWADYSRVHNCLHLIRDLEIRRMIVIGAATGKVLEAFHEELGLYPRGCEVSAWAHARIPARYRQHIERADMRDYLPRLAKEGMRADLIFTNSLIYLDPLDLPAVLASMAQIGRYVHFESSFKESHCEDPYRRILKPYAWWARQFQRAGFERTRSKYLWRVPADI